MNATTIPPISTNAHTTWRALSGGVALGTIALGLINVAVAVWVLALRGAIPLSVGYVVSAINAYCAFTVMH